MAYNKGNNQRVEEFLDILYSYDFERKEKTLNEFRRHISSSYVFPKAIKGKELTKINVYDVWIEFRLSFYNSGNIYWDVLFDLFSTDLDLGSELDINYMTAVIPNGSRIQMCHPCCAGLLVGYKREIQ